MAPVDEFSVQKLQECQGKRLRSITKEGLDTGTEGVKRTHSWRPSWSKDGCRGGDDVILPKAGVIVAAASCLPVPSSRTAAAQSARPNGWAS